MSKDEERYDVSQHDGITKGKWEIRRSGSSIDVVVYADDEKRAFSPIINFTREYADAVMKIDRDRADLEAIASLPEILDALKEAYEEIDLLRRKIRLLDVVHDIPNALDAEIKGYGHFREEELAGLYDASEEE
jgi:hypothetical protein